MLSRIRKLLNKPFIKNVLIMATGTFGAQVVKMLTSPLITRIYGPDAFGVMGVFVSIIQILIPIAALTYPTAIVLPKSDLIAKGLIRLSLYISFVISIIIFLILLLFNKAIINTFKLEEVSLYLYLIPLVIIFTTLMQVLEQWYIRKKKFRINAKATFYQAVAIEFGKIGIGVVIPIGSVLVILTAFSNGIKALLLVIFARVRVSGYVYKKRQVSFLSIKKLAKKYKDFPLLRAPQALIDAITQGLPVLMLTSLFNPIAAGFFTLCRTVLTLPSSLIGKAVGDVFYQRVNEAFLNKEKLSSLIKKAVLFLSAIGIVPFMFIVVFGPKLFGFLFGDIWYTAGEYARWMALSLFFRFINEPCIRALPVLSAQSLHLFITILQTFIRILAIWIGFFIFKDDTMAIALYGLTGALINLLLIVLTIKRSKKFETDYTV